jgi:pimeloyl-ACP methyl ester carboxylesterase
MTDEIWRGKGRLYDMKRLNLALGILLMLLGPAAAHAAPAQSVLEGEWVGGSNLFKNPVFIHLRFHETSNGLSGVADVQNWRMVRRALSVVSVDGLQLRFEIPSTTGEKFVGEGRIEGEVVRGTLRRGEEQGSFHLLRVASVNRRILEAYTGTYTFKNEERGGKSEEHLVTWGSLYGEHLRWVNLSDGSTTALFPISENRFLFASAVVASPTPAATWTFEKVGDGKAMRSIVSVMNRPDQIGSKSNLIAQGQVTLRNGSVTLAATLTSPATKGPHPAIVFIPGSGDRQTRDESSPFREFEALIRAGFAILVYDKRGLGNSTGDWQKASFDDLAGDALAAVNFLKRHRDIDAKRIGLWGFSQGGWIAPLAASRSKTVAFVIMASGGGVTPREAEVNEQLARLHMRKLSDAEIKEALAFMNLQFEAVANDRAWERFQTETPKVRGAKWYRHTWGGVSRENWLWAWWRPLVNYDPAPVLEKVKVPVLVLYGGADTVTVPEAILASVERIGRALRKGGNLDYTSRIFPKASHDLSVFENDRWVAPPDYHSTLIGWLQRVTRQK